MKNTILLSILISIFFTSPGIAEENEIDVDKLKNAQTADSKSISNGRELFTERCSVCHGEKADGKGPSAESFDMTPWSFTDGTIDDISDGYLFQKIKNGGVWYEMPPFGLILKNNEIWDIINFLKSISNKS